MSYVTVDTRGLGMIMAPLAATASTATIGSGSGAGMSEPGFDWTGLISQVPGVVSSVGAGITERIQSMTAAAREKAEALAAAARAKAEEEARRKRAAAAPSESDAPWGTVAVVGIGVFTLLGAMYIFSR